MFDRLQKKLSSMQSRDKITLWASLFAIVILALWIFQTGDPQNPNQGTEEEFGVTIPQGFLLLPLELSNASSVASMISRRGVVDVFLGPRPRPIASNLRVIKLFANEGPLFGALIPEGQAGHLQEVFSRPGLRAAVRTTHAGPTKFHVKLAARSWLTEIPVED